MTEDDIRAAFERELAHGVLIECPCGVKWICVGKVHLTCRTCPMCKRKAKAKKPQSPARQHNSGA